MALPIQTDQATLELDKYLSKNDYFDGSVVSTHQITVFWKAIFKDAIAHDLESRFKGIKVDAISSELSLSSEDDQGACVFFHKAALVDTGTLEVIHVFIKNIVNYHKTVIYSGGSGTESGKWTVRSETLKQIFERLKTADKQVGYFNPITLKALMTG